MADAVLVPGAPGYPPLLAALGRRAPSPLFARGPIAGLEPSIAIVGSRHASPRGLSIAGELAAAVARAGVTVVSGGALGIDAAAHAGALSARGRTVVVLPTPLCAPAPRRNRRLFAEVLEQGGAWVSEHAGGSVARFGFASRNRIIAGLAGAVIVIEARARSGTRHTVLAAQALGRPVGAIPWRLGEPQAAGFVEILRAGGVLIAEAQDALSLLDLSLPDQLERSQPALDPLEAAIVSALGGRAENSDRLAELTQRPVPEVLAALTTLELLGVIEDRGGCFVLRASAM
jgi:DNA processing protein